MALTPKFFDHLDRKRPGHYVRIGKTRLYYEVYGRGKPLLLFHGGLSCIEGLRYQIPFFARHFKVIVPERPGHGRSADTAGPYRYENLARLTDAFMKKLHLKKARMMGYSDGANLIYWLAAKYPARVDRFISVGGNFHYRGCEKIFQMELRRQKPQIDPRYAALSPDGAAHYPVVFNKCRRLWLEEPRWTKNLLRKIKAPALIVAGDRDMIRHEHSLEIFRSLRTSQLAVVPGTGHSLLKEKPELVNAMMLQFLQSSCR